MLTVQINNKNVLQRVSVLSIYLTFVFLWTSHGLAADLNKDLDLAFVAAEEGLWQLWRADSRKEVRREKITRSPVDIRSPQWSPNGKSIVYATRDGFLYILHLGGRTSRLVLPSMNNGEPAWSPDGRFIAYINYSNPRAYQSELWSVHLQPGGDVEKHQRIEIPPGLVTFPCWDKDAISYSRLEKVDYSGVVENICRFDLKKNEEEILIADGFDNIHPAWSPDGASLAYASNRNGNFDIWLWNPDKDEHHQLTSDPAMDHYPSWSADGRAIAFSSSRTGLSQVWIVEVETKYLRQVSFGEQGSRDPSWLKNVKE